MSVGLFRTSGIAVELVEMRVLTIPMLNWTPCFVAWRNVMTRLMKLEGAKVYTVLSHFWNSLRGERQNGGWIA